MTNLLSAQNGSTILGNDEEILCFSNETSYHEHFLAKSALSILYGLVFMTAVCGNSLVIYVVVTNKHMQSVTNLFITNLALSDIVVNFTSLWLTPVYSYLGRWVWGSVMCHLVPLFQGMSIFISSLTLMAIAIDRFIAILYPFRPRTSFKMCGTVVVSIWLIGLLLVMPLAIQMNLHYFEECQLYICREEWATYPEMRVVYGFVVLSLQFGVPFLVIAFCYVRIWIHLMYRRSMVLTTARSEADERRRRRLLKMLVAMVVIYVLAWLPVNALNVLRDATNIDHQEYFVVVFLFAHLSSMSATCWNPIVYAWMNDNFRREFKAVLPCFRTAERLQDRSQSVTGFGAPRRSLVTTLETIPGVNRRSSGAISSDSPAENSPRSKRRSVRISREASSYNMENHCEIDNRDRQVSNNDFNPKMSQRSVGSTSKLIPTASLKSRSAKKIAERKLTGRRKKSKSKSDFETSATKFLSPPRRNSSSNAANGKVHHIDCDLDARRELLSDQTTANSDDHEDLKNIVVFVQTSV